MFDDLKKRLSNGNASYFIRLYSDALKYLYKIKSNDNTKTISDDDKEKFFKHFLIAVFNILENKEVRTKENSINIGSDKTDSELELFKKKFIDKHMPDNLDSENPEQPNMIPIQDSKNVKIVIGKAHSINRVAYQLYQQLTNNQKIIIYDKLQSLNTNISTAKKINNYDEVFAKIDFNELFLTHLHTVDSKEFDKTLVEFAKRTDKITSCETKISNLSSHLLTDKERNDQGSDLISFKLLNMVLLNKKKELTKPEKHIRITSSENFNIEYDQKILDPDQNEQLPLKTDEEKNIFDNIGDFFKKFLTDVPEIFSSLSCGSSIEKTSSNNRQNNSPSPHIKLKSNEQTYSSFFWSPKTYSDTCK